MASHREMEGSGGGGEFWQTVRDSISPAENLVVAFQVAKSQTSSWSAAGGGRSAIATKHRILALTVKPSKVSHKSKVRLQVLKESANRLQAEKVYKLSHLSKVEGVPDDKSGCTFILGFDSLRNQTGAPHQWSVRNVDDRNRLLTSIVKLCKVHHGRTPRIVGMDVVEMELWAQRNAKSVPAQVQALEDRVDVGRGEDEGEAEPVTVQEDLVSKGEEEDMEALLGTYVLGIDEAEAFSERLNRELGALEAANVHAILESEPLVHEVLQQLDVAVGSLNDMDEWLDIVNVKLRHMALDMASIEAKNNRLEMQAHNNSFLVRELHVLTERWRVPPAYAATLTGGGFGEAQMAQNLEACEWLAAALRGLEPPSLDAGYASMRGVRDKRAELEKLKDTFVGRASTFLRDYFSSITEFMLSDKAYFSQKGQLKRPDHTDLRFKCRTYARMLQHLKNLDKNSLAPLRKAYCSALNLLLRREAREFANELRGSAKVPSGPDKTEGQQTPPTTPTGASSTVPEAYAKMLRIFVPLLIDESSFFASFMCFEVQPLCPQANGDEEEEDMHATHVKKATDQSPAELEALNQALQELLDGIQEDFYVVVDWAHRVQPLSCIAMQIVTERYLSSHKADAVEFVRRLLDELRSRIQDQFHLFVVEANKRFEKDDRGPKQTGVLSCILEFSNMAADMELLIGESPRDDVDAAYQKLLTTIFTVLETISKNDPKNADVFVLENYAAFQDSIYDLATASPVLETFYNRAFDAYDLASLRYVHSMMNYQFERFFLFGQKLENMLISIEPEQIPSTVGFTRTDLRRILKASLSGVEKSLQATHKRMQKGLQRQELLPSLWDEKFKSTFLDKYKSLEELVATCYKGEVLSPSSTEMKAMLDSVKGANP